VTSSATYLYGLSPALLYEGVVGPTFRQDLSSALIRGRARDPRFAGISHSQELRKPKPSNGFEDPCGRVEFRTGPEGPLTQRSINRLGARRIVFQRTLLCYERQAGSSCGVEAWRSFSVTQPTSPDKYRVALVPEMFSQQDFQSLGFGASFDRVVSPIEPSFQPESQPLVVAFWLRRPNSSVAANA
jgi:hypothetical protein